jgi:hypothetical protein
MFHIVYKITNLQNDKYYFGVHSTKDIDDGYMGSGTLLRKDIKSFGIDCFEREILHIEETRELALLKEKELITVDVLRDQNCYNLIFGGGAVRTIPEKRALFNKNARQYVFKEPQFKKFDEEYYYEFQLIKEFKFVPVSNRLHPFLDIVQPEFLLPRVNECYNNLYTNKSADKFVNMLNSTREGYYNNIICYKKKWQDQQSTQKN